MVDAATVIIGTPTVLIGAHPAAVYCSALVNALRPKTKFAGIIGSYSWGSKMVEQITGLMGNLKLELFEPVLSKGLAIETPTRPSMTWRTKLRISTANCS
jgi:flavorubredoxin